ncbi:E3 ubiquitin-protein ligase ATL42-like [Eucalyptus grandis]|uniref:E3 ubiquitin-protein ligase ATL42-like n=1 Tax=Eucalyptus grandis TaxID=71139 RepID=UPI00192ECB43|nr:E3 ubiquitin-protein ligase ATL42-like [Eucalyptus grandis]
MNRAHVYVLIFCWVFFLHVEAQIPPQGPIISQDDSNFQPSLVVVMAILSLMFLLACVLIVYAKYCLSSRSAIHGNPEARLGLARSRSQLSGIDKTVIESLPFFRFSSLRGSKEGLECAVCLSKFEDVEILRLLPQCKHAFHIECIDRWLENHSSCPICRLRLSVEDPAIFTYSSSMRLWNQSSRHDDSNPELLFVQREEGNRGSSRFGIGRSLRRMFKADREDEVSIRDAARNADQDPRGDLHKFNHRILVPDGFFKNRWSNVSSSDLMFLNSEMLSSASSNRFSSLEANPGQSKTSRANDEGQIGKIREEMELKRLFESKPGPKSLTSPAPTAGLPPPTAMGRSKYLVLDEKRSMSEITGVSRLGELNRKSRYTQEASSQENGWGSSREERMRRLWLPIARRTAQWFANRDRRSQDSENQNLRLKPEDV